MSFTLSQSILNCLRQNKRKCITTVFIRYTQHYRNVIIYWPFSIPRHFTEIEPHYKKRSEPKIRWKWCSTLWNLYPWAHEDTLFNIYGYNNGHTSIYHSLYCWTYSCCSPTETCQQVTCWLQIFEVSTWPSRLYCHTMKIEIKQEWKEKICNKTWQSLSF